MTQESFSDRLTVLRIERRLSGRAFAKAAGLKSSTYQALTTGRSPTLDTLVIIANSLGVNVGWLATGEGPKYLSEPGKQADFGGFSEHQAPYVAGPDPELLGRIVDVVARVHREERVRLPDVDLGRVAAERYAEVAAMATDPEEWPALLDLVAVRVRRAVRAAAADPTSTKREA